MEYYRYYRSWMYDRTYPGRTGLKPNFEEGVKGFIAFAVAQETYKVEEGIRCPCTKCTCRFIKTPVEVSNHLKKVGFMKDYWVWTNNGEQLVFPEVHANNTVASTSGMHEEYVEQFNLIDDMVGDALGVNMDYGEDEDDDVFEEQVPNEKAQKFYEMLREMNTPLFEGASDSTLSMCVRLLAAKSNWNVPDMCLEFVTKMMLDVTPVKDNMPKSYYDAKKLVSKLGLEAKRIDCCTNGCMLFYDNEFGTNDGALEECRFCNSPRYHVRNKAVDGKRRVPVKSMFYLPIIPRLQRLFASNKTADQMTWHNTDKTPGVLQHPSDGEAWKHFNRVHPDFAADPRNVRLGLCSDGFTPYIQASTSPYSCWPVIVTPYNLPPEMCMSKPYMFLACLIPGPSNPKAGIDVYLQPLIDDLKRLWVGEWTYDISRKQNFTMRAALMWTINDFPAYGMLSGWGTHGKMACPHCMEHTKAFTLKSGGKASWFDSHRRFLPENHEFRRSKNAFKKGEREADGPPPKLKPEEVWNKVCRLPKFTDFGKPVTIPGYGL
ncbi:hypothetical protein QL285_016112 [Trifolium repens]|nr:hypothetical protein QL285_016112 [Trifolium repens]